MHSKRQKCYVWGKMGGTGTFSKKTIYVLCHLALPAKVQLARHFKNILYSMTWLHLKYWKKRLPPENESLVTLPSLVIVVCLIRTWQDRWAPLKMNLSEGVFQHDHDSFTPLLFLLLSCNLFFLNPKDFRFVSLFFPTATLTNILTMHWLTVVPEFIGLSSLYDWRGHVFGGRAE